MRKQSTPFHIIPITGGKSILIDECDLHLVQSHKWLARPNSQGSYYVARTKKRNPLPPTTIYLHRIIMDAKPGEYVDHRNRNPLDNRRSNLRFCTPSQNQQNHKRRSKANTSGYKGVCTSRAGKPWRAQITIEGRSRSLGQYNTKEEAARAYDAAAIAHFGEFATLNFPNERVA